MEKFNMFLHLFQFIIIILLFFQVIFIARRLRRFEIYTKSKDIQSVESTSKEGLSQEKNG